MVQLLIARWGNSLAVRLPRTVAATARLVEGTPVEMRVEGDAIVVTRARPRLRLDDLVAATRPEHSHGEFDWGPAVGKEAW